MKNATTQFWNDYNFIICHLEKEGLPSFIHEYKNYKVYESEGFRIRYYYLLVGDRHVVDVSVDHDGYTVVYEVYDSLTKRRIKDLFGKHILDKICA